MSVYAKGLVPYCTSHAMTFEVYHDGLCFTGSNFSYGAVFIVTTCDRLTPYMEMHLGDVVVNYSYGYFLVLVKGIYCPKYSLLPSTIYYSTMCRMSIYIVRTTPTSLSDLVISYLYLGVYERVYLGYALFTHGFGIMVYRSHLSRPWLLHVPRVKLTFRARTISRLLGYYGLYFCVYGILFNGDDQGVTSPLVYLLYV